MKTLLNPSDYPRKVELDDGSTHSMAPWSMIQVDAELRVVRVVAFPRAEGRTSSATKAD